LDLDLGTADRDAINQTGEVGIRGGAASRLFANGLSDEDFDIRGRNPND
jgi:hypothetical protein